MKELIRRFSQDIPSVLDIFDDDSFFSCRRFDDVKVDILEHDDKVEVVAMTPGFDKNNINVKYEKGSLIISGKIKKDDDNKNKKYLYRETTNKLFSRSFYLGDLFDKTNIDAHFKNGILTIILPKKEEEKFKQINIK